MGRFGISQPVLRREDARLLTGGGQFVDDLRRPALARGFMLRSPHGHARIAVIERRRRGIRAKEEAHVGVASTRAWAPFGFSSACLKGVYPNVRETIRVMGR